MEGKLSGFVRSLLCGVFVPSWVKELTVFEAVEDGSKHHASNGNDSALMAPAALDLLITFSVVREFLVPESGQSTLYQQRLEVNASPADANGFLFTGTLVVGGSKSGPRAKVLGGMELGHIHTDFGQSSQSGEIGNAWHRSDDLKLGGKGDGEIGGNLLDLFHKIFELIEVRFAQGNLLGLWGCDQSINGKCDVVSLIEHRAVKKPPDIKIPVAGMIQQMINNGGSGLAKGIGDHGGQHDVRDSEGVLDAVLLAGGKRNQLEVVANEIANLPNLLGWDKATRHKPMFMEIGNPDGILLVGLLASDRLDILGMCQGDPARRFKDVVDRNPILAGGFHADVDTSGGLEPFGKSTEVFGKGRESFGLVRGDASLVGGRDGCDDEGLVDIHPATDRIDDFEHAIPPDTFTVRRQ